MSTDEFLDAFDEKGQHLGVLPRAEVHRRGLWHQVAHILVVAVRDDEPTAILQRRASTKRTFPDLIDLSATGHLAAGERPRDGIRELREELGIDIDPDLLVALGVRRMVDATPEGINRELTHVFLVRDDRPIVEYRPDPIEVSSVVEVSIAMLLRVFDETNENRTALAAEVTADGEQRTVHLAADDLVPEPALGDGVATQPYAYWISVLNAGLSYIEGRHPLAI